MSIRNKVLGVTLPSLLLAGMTVYADEEVTLKAVGEQEAKTVGWSEFVNAINDPSSLVNEEDETLVAAQNAENAKKEASETAEDKLKEGGELQTALSEAIAAQKTEKEIKDAETAYEDAKTELSSKKDLLSKLQTQQSNKNIELQQAQARLTQASTDYSMLEKHTVTTRTIKTWLSTILEAAEAFESEYDAYLEWEPEDETETFDYKNEIWYKSSTNKTGAITLTIAFNKKPNDGGTWEKANVDDLYTFLYVTNASSKVGTLYVYLGTEYKTLNTTDTSAGSETLKVSTYQGDKYYVIQNAAEAVRTLASQDKYNDLTYTTVYADEETREDLEEEIAAAKTAIADINVALNGRHGTEEEPLKEGETEVYGIVEQINDTQERINTLNETEIPQKEQAWNNAAATVTAVETAQSNLDAAQAAAEKAAKEYADAQAYTETVKTNLEAVAIAPYKDVKLNADLVAADGKVITGSFDGTIDGQGYSITLPAGTPLMAELATGGIVENLAVNGTITNRNNGKYYTVATWSGSAGVFYDDSATRTPSNSNTIGAFGVEMREYFGADLANNKLVAKADDTKVYTITVYKPTDNGIDTFANLVLNEEDEYEFVGEGGAVAIPTNHFAKCDDSVIKKKNMVNVFYKEGNQNVCENVVIVDKLDFYAPEEILAKKVSYDRPFIQGQNAVCLPFAVETSDNANIKAVCLYDEETPTKFWFKKLTTVPANSPMLLIAEEAFTGINKNSDVIIPATPRNQMVIDEGNEEDPSKAYGVLKYIDSSNIGKSSESYKVWGLSGGSFVAVKDEAKFPAFRMAIRSELAQANGANLAPRKIAIRDEKGIEIPGLIDFETGVEEVAVATSFEVAGGQGEIIFTADADYGKVPVYTVDGHVATVANVTAGTTSANVQKGIYIVNGKKVMVK